MRLVLVNPHTFAYGKSMSAFIFRKRMFMKYDFFIQFYIKNRRRDVAFFIDGARTSFGIAIPFLAKSAASIELLFWMIINGINPFRVRVYSDINKLDPRNDVLFDFSRSLVDVDEKTAPRLRLNRFQGVVFIHFTHYFKGITKLAEYIKTIPHCIIAAESDLASNNFFRKFFPSIQETYQLPYSFSERFVLQKEYNNRINKCLAVGTMCMVKEKEFVGFFGAERTLHPMRKVIFDRHQELTGEIDSLIKGFDDVMRLRQSNDTDSLSLKFLKKFLPYIILEKFISSRQKDYFKFDIVKQFNNYRMFICPEELVGLPSVNAFEGMACKCAYVGIEDPMYTNLGLIPGIHYITYKRDDMEDLLLKIRYYQTHPEELERIAENGYNFVRKNFNRENIANLLWNDMEAISKNFFEHRKASLHCSFKRKF